MRVLMFGWELPPENSGGLGVACFNLTKALSKKNTEVIFVLPKKKNVFSGGFSVVFADVSVTVREVDSLLSAYLNSERYRKLLQDVGIDNFYGNSLFEEVARYGKLARKIALKENFDVIHAHDWLSFLAGVEAKKVSGKPLVVHVHATEFDRTGGTGVNQLVYEVEKFGMQKANKVLAVSNLTKNMIVKHYGIPAEKIEVVYNAQEEREVKRHKDLLKDILHRPVVAFVGRITIQKGPDYFLAAAKKCLKYNPNILFVMAGSGDMQHQIMEKAAYMGIAENFLFSGFLRGEELDRLYQSANLYVMPSVSEPFGLTVLESIQNGTPVLISKQTGVGENLTHCLKTDFWDVDDMAAKILAVVEHKELESCLAENSQKDISKFSWSKAAEKCVKVYKKVIHYK